MKKTIAALLLLIAMQIASGQKSRRGLGFRTEASAIDGFEMKGGFNFGFFHPSIDFMPFGYQGPFALAGYGISHNRAYISSHIGYEYYYLIVAVRAGIVANTDFQKSTIGFLPEAGHTMMGGISFMYGYNAPLSNEKGIGLTKHRLSLSFTFPLWIDGEWLLKENRITRGL